MSPGSIPCCPGRAAEQESPPGCRWWCSSKHKSCVHAEYGEWARRGGIQLKDVLFCGVCAAESTKLRLLESPTGWSWYTSHTLKYGVKVRRVSWGLWTCWGRAGQGDSDLVQRNSEKSLLHQSTSWAPSQRETPQVCSKQEFRKELSSLLCAKEDWAWGKSWVKSLVAYLPE